MQRINHLVILFLLSVSISCSHSKQLKLQPNIILISVDDMGWSDLGCYGSEINTPNIDQLATQGMRFRNFYNTSKCFPSRACLITGVYAQDCGYSETFNNPISNAVTIGEVLRTAGYRTYWSGKHHGKENPYNRGFDHYFGLKDGACNHFNPGQQREGEKAPAQKRTNRSWAIDSTLYKPFSPAKGFYTTDVFTSYAIKYVKEATRMQKPFFLYLAYTAPHDPLMAWPADIAKYQGRYDLGYDSIRAKRFEKQKEIGLLNSDLPISTSAYPAWTDLSPNEKQYEVDKMEVYAAMIDRMDQNLGRLLRTLHDNGISENTIIFFVSDNGASAEIVNLKNDDDHAKVGSMERWVSLGPNWANVANTPYRFYKNYSHEGGIKTPMIAWYPKMIESNSFSDYPGHFIDFMSTFCELSHAEYPSTFNEYEVTPTRGTSLVPVLKGKKTQRNEPLFWNWKNGQAMQTKGWKIVKYGKGAEWELYNLNEDPYETTDRSKQDEKRVKKMIGKYNEWLNQYD